MKEHPFSRLKLLIVDDHNFSRITLLRLLKNMGDPEVQSATNGVEALSLLPTINFHAVILDFNMPLLHGLQVLKAIRIGHKNIRRNIPVLMLTGHSDAALVELAVQLDVNSFLLKPVTKEALTPRLGAIIGIQMDDYSNLKSVEDYEALDVDTRVMEILDANAASQFQEVSLKTQEEVVFVEEDVPAMTGKEMRVQDLYTGLILDNDVMSKQGDSVIFKKDHVLSAQNIQQLQDLEGMEMISKRVVVRFS